MKFFVFTKIYILFTSVILPYLITAQSVSDGFICDLLTATNIKDKLFDWSCVKWGYPSTNVCTWTGISCTADVIQSIHLPSLGLIGTIPSSIGGVTSLTYLDLNTNSLYGSIPTTIKSLSRLMNLRLYLNSFTGSIPNEIGYLTDLSYLLLNGNKLQSTIPSSIGKLSQNLRYLFLNYILIIFMVSYHLNYII